MPYLNKPSEQPSLFSLGCKWKKHAPYVHPSEVLGVMRDCASMNRRLVPTCCDAELPGFLNEIGGLDMFTVRLYGLSIQLPEVIPVIPPGLFELAPERIPHRIVAVMLNSILTKRLRLHLGRNYKMPRGTRIDNNILSRPVFRGKQVILLCSGQDILIETVWWKRYDVQLYDTLSKMGFLAITGMNFSIIDGECPVAHGLNIKKSLFFSGEIEATGIPAIPHIYAQSRHQLERWIKWLQANPAVKIITMNSQLQNHRSHDLKKFYESMRTILEHTSVNIMIQGGTHLFPVELCPFFNRIHFAIAGPCKKAQIFKAKSPAAYLHDFSMDLRRICPIVTKTSTQLLIK